MAKASSSEKANVFDLVEGLVPVDESVLENFVRAMNEQVIPEIVREEEERRILAAESRRWPLKC